MLFLMLLLIIFFQILLFIFILSLRAGPLGHVAVQSVRSSRARQTYSRRRTLPSNEHRTAPSCLFTMHLRLLADARLVLAMD